MKFLCIACDTVMEFAERQLPGDGTMAAVFTCGRCHREVAMLTNPMETQLVSSLGIRVGGRTVPEQPMELLRSSLATGGNAFTDSETEAETETKTGSSQFPSPSPSPSPSVVWSGAAQERLARVPSFVRGMVKRIYSDYARERSIVTITPEVMDRARTDLGLEGM
jgi:Proto-chlorophyllide reductase 57 kD subunit